MGVLDSHMIAFLTVVRDAEKFGQLDDYGMVIAYNKAYPLAELEELEREIQSLGPDWNLFGKVDRMKLLIKKLKGNEPI